jgi:uncharacterized BrkB/YihY/UPF0761 family membrane protein
LPPSSKCYPDAKISWRSVWVGAAGSLAVLLLWVYYSALILLFGAEFTETWA